MRSESWHSDSKPTINEGYVSFLTDRFLHSLIYKEYISNLRNLGHYQTPTVSCVVVRSVIRRWFYYLC